MWISQDGRCYSGDCLLGDRQATAGEVAAWRETVRPVASCTPWQMRKALNQMGLRAAVESAVASSGNQELIDGWEFATEFRSDDVFVLSMGQALGKTSDETRELIAFAATL